MIRTTVLVASPDLQASLAFYKTLDFYHLQKDGRHFFLDGGVVLEVSEDKMVRSGLRLYQKSWDLEVEELKKITNVVENGSTYVFNDFCGVRIELVKEDLAIDFSSKLDHRSFLGKSAGLSLEGISISHMYQIWEILGFKKTMGDINGGWMTAVDEGNFAVSLMSLGSCPHMFYNPSLSYFNGADNMKVIGKVRKARIEITEEITVFNKVGIVDNIIIRDPGGLGFFIFND